LRYSWVYTIDKNTRFVEFWGRVLKNSYIFESKLFFRINSPTPIAMKKFFLMLVLGSFVALNFSACKAKTDSPEKVVEAFLNYLSEDNFEKAMAISTPETVEVLKQWQEEGFNLYKGNKIKDVECIMFTDTEAECSFYAFGSRTKKRDAWHKKLAKTRFYTDGSRDMIEAILINGKWKAHMEK